MEFNDFAEELLKMRDRDLALRRKLEEAGRLEQQKMESYTPGFDSVLMAE